MILYTVDKAGYERWVDCGFCQSKDDEVFWATKSDGPLNSAVRHRHQDFKVIHLLTDDYRAIRKFKRASSELQGKP